MAWRPRTTPSTTVETLGSTPSLKLSVPTPRTLRPWPRLLLESLKARLGETSGRFSTLLICCCSRRAPETTATETGTSCRLSLRFWAVTTTSSMRTGSAVCWASAPPAIINIANPLTPPHSMARPIP